MRQAFFVGVERMTGIEPAYSAWEADVLPLNYIRIYLILAHIRRVFKRVRRNFALIMKKFLIKIFDYFRVHTMLFYYVIGKMNILCIFFVFSLII